MMVKPDLTIQPIPVFVVLPDMKVKDFRQKQQLIGVETFPSALLVP
jgi:hypothetical protein